MYMYKTKHIQIWRAGAVRHTQDTRLQLSASSLTRSVLVSPGQRTDRICVEAPFQIRFRKKALAVTITFCVTDFVLFLFSYMKTDIL